MHISPTSIAAVPLAADGHNHRRPSPSAPAPADPPRDTKPAAGQLARPGSIDVVA